MLTVGAPSWSSALSCWKGSSRPPAAPGASAGTVAADVAAALAGPAGIPVVLAGSDGVCAELGAGWLDPGQLMATSAHCRGIGQRGAA